MNIYEKLLKIQSQLKAPKGQTNTFGGYKYRSCEDIFDAVKGYLAETKTVLTVHDMIEQVGDRYYVMAQATLVDAEKPGDIVTNVAWAREADEKRGLDASQITGSSSSYARKYALCGLFAIGGEADADAWNAGDGQPKQKGRTKKDDKPTTGESATMSYVKKMIAKYEYRNFGQQLLDHYGVDALEKMSAEQMAMAAKQAEAYDAVHAEEKEAQG